MKLWWESIFTSIQLIAKLHIQKSDLVESDINDEYDVEEESDTEDGYLCPTQSVFVWLISNHISKCYQEVSNTSNHELVEELHSVFFATY